MALNIKTEPMEDRQMSLLVEVDQERVDSELRKAARKVARQYRIPGFRQGKAPYTVILQYVGLPTLFNEFIEPLGQEIYQKALEEIDFEPYAQAQLDIDSLEPLTYKFTVPLEPEIELGDYRSLRVEETPVEVTDEEINAQLEEYLEEYAEYGEVDRPSEYGDLLTIDVKSVIVDDEAEEPTVVLDETDWDVTPDEENPMEPPGFDEALLGMSPGDEKEFTLEWPADSQSIYAGKQAKFDVKLHKIEAHSKPELNDEFAQMVGPDFKTLDDLKNNIRESLVEERQAEAENEYLDKALDELVAQTTMVYPPVVVEDQIDVMVNELERQLRQYGIESAEDYLRQMGQDLEQYRESLRENAEVIARRNLVISELYSQEGIDVAEEDLEERINRMIGEMGGDGEEESESTQALREMMRSGSGRAVIESQVLQEKALERLLAIVRGEELPPKGEPKAAGAADEAATEDADAGDEAEVAETSDEPAAESSES